MDFNRLILLLNYYRITIEYIKLYIYIFQVKYFIFINMYLKLGSQNGITSFNSYFVQYNVYNCILFIDFL